MLQLFKIISNLNTNISKHDSKYGSIMIEHDHTILKHDPTMIPMFPKAGIRGETKRVSWGASSFYAQPAGLLPV